MISQLRIYTVNRGMMDQWVQHFKEVSVPMHEKHGMEIEGPWVNEDKNQFIWIRNFADADDMKAKLKARDASPEWKAVVDHSRSYLARVDVQIMSPA
jgi:hypothetical protein